MSKSISFLFFIRNVVVASFAVLFMVRIATIIRLLADDFECGVLDILQGFGEDLWFLLIIGFPVYVLGRIIYTFHSGVSKTLVLGIYALALFLQIGLNEYFLTVHQIVDSSIFNFSFEELQKTVGLSERFTLWTIVGLLAILFIFIFVFRKLNKGKNNYVLSQSYFALVVGALSWMFLPLYNSNKEVAANELGVESNVSLLLLHSALSAKNERTSSHVSRNDFERLDESFTNGKLDKSDYPLFRTMSGESTLSQMLNRGEGAPNIVYIICEGLSSDFLGDKASYSGHLMPFMDSLSGQSLYYPNALSTSQRTQNVLPSSLCSVPNVSEGVVFQQMDYPNHYSVQGLLKKEYSTGFYCGVQLEYMNMRGFMNEHNVKRLSGKWTKDVMEETKRINSPWGVPDGALFQQHLSELQKVKQKPFFDVLLTISTHDPYVYPNKEQYTKRLLNNVSTLTKTALIRDVEENAEKFASYMYLDEQLKLYFSAFAKKPAYKNTIFVITGDHGSELWNRSALSKYHVPILIYSPLLKHPKKVESIVSHLDVAPSIHALLKNDYKINIPQKTAYLGKQLLLNNSDEKRSFMFTTDQLKMKDLCFKETFLIDYQLYALTKDFGLKNVQNPALLKKMNDQKQLYKLFSEFVLLGNQLIPNEDFAAFYENTRWEDVQSLKTEINKDVDFREVVNIGKAERRWLNKSKLRITVNIKVERSKFRSNDSLPDLVLSKVAFTKMDRKKAVYRMIRPVKVAEDNSFSWYRYVLIFDAKQLSKESEMKEGFLYLYYKMKNSPRVIDSETVISIPQS